MHLTTRSLVLVALAALLAIAAMWSGAATLRWLWAAPLALLALGLAFESARRSQLVLEVSPLLPPRFYLGRETVVVLRLRHDAASTLRLELLPRVPDCLAGDPATLRLKLPPGQNTELLLPLTRVALGVFHWQSLPARLLGAFGLAAWSRELAVAATGRVQPDLHVHRQSGRPGWRAGLRARREAGTGSDLQQLRGYRPGDPRSRIAWRASARHGQLLVREFSDEQQIDLLLVVDAGLRSRARAARLDRLGAAALLRVRALLAEARVATVESDPVAAALQTRRLLRHRGLVVWLTEIDDAAAVGDLGSVLQLLTPPHLVVFAGASSGEIGVLARTPARADRDVWVALAAGEHEERLAAGLQRLQRRGAPVVAAPAEQLEPAVLATYARLRGRHRV